jgi:GxxExxY protein
VERSLKIEKLNCLSGQILDAAIEVHRVLGGPGLLESVYTEALAYELELRGSKVERQKAIPIKYKNHNIKHPLFLDLFIDEEIIVEVKSTEKFNPVYNAQLLTYLRLANKPLGLIINFGEQFVKKGFHRIVNNFP